MKNNNGEEYINSNRIGWDEAAPIHRRITFDKLKTSFQNPKYIYINRIALQAFQQIGIKGKSIAHLMCNNGRELLSLKRLGAARCVGYDFSENFINQGIELANSANLECEFICSDVFKIPNSYNKQFDIVFISSGSIRWVPDLSLFFRVIKNLLNRAGMLLITEMHPILNIIDDNKKDRVQKNIKHSYFRKEPFKNTGGLNYWQDQEYDSHPVYYFQHTLGEIISQCLGQKMNLVQFYEHSMDLSGGRFSRQDDIKFPLSFSLLARNIEE